EGVDRPQRLDSPACCPAVSGTRLAVSLVMSTLQRPRLARVATDPVESAKLAGLRYVSETGPGLRRRRAGRGFVFLDAEGRRLRDGATLHRIRSLVIPPAWTDVWICPSPGGHIQAV